MFGQQLELLSEGPRWAVQTVMFTPESEMPRRNLEDGGVDSGLFARSLWERNILRED